MTRGFVIGGVGGSGTRAVCALLHSISPFHQLRDRNKANDTLGATLLFKRPSILDPHTDMGFDECWSMLRGRMEGTLHLRRSDLVKILSLATEKRLHHSRRWMLMRAARFCFHESSPASADSRWLVKEPNLQIFAESILAGDPDVRMAIVMRNGLDMAFSRNRQQAATWGEIDGDVRPSDMLRHWCLSHERLLEVRDAYPDRLIFIQLERACDHPDELIEPLGRFLETDDEDSIAAAIREHIRENPSRNRHLDEDMSVLGADLIERAHAIVSKIT